jgi:hypothetical protein
VAPAAIPFGLAIGLALGMLGGGGSVLAVPVLVYVLGQDVETATTTSLVVVTAAALAGGAGHVPAGHVCWRHAAAFAVAAVPAIVAGTALGEAVGGAALLAGFAVVMLVAAAATWDRAARGDAAGRHRAAGGDAAGRHRAAGVGAASGPARAACGAAGAAAGSGRPARRGGCPPLRPGRDAGAGACVGLLAGVFGVGGGFVVVPALVLGLAFPMRHAIGTSLAVVAAVSVLGVAVHLAAGRTLDPGLTAAFGAACVVGALAGARLSGRVPQQALCRAFAGLVVLVAGWLLVSAVLLSGPPGGAG